MEGCEPLSFCWAFSYFVQRNVYTCVCMRHATWPAMLPPQPLFLHFPSAAVVYKTRAVPCLGATV